MRLGVSQVALVTGATGGIGRVVATELARLGSTVVIVARDAGGGERLRQRIAADVGADRVEVLAEVRRIAAEFSARHARLPVLINNAGANFRRRSVSVDGVEMNLAVNHLAGFGLTALLLDRLRAGAPARVVNVVSAAMSDTRPGSIGRARPVTVNAVHPGLVATDIHENVVGPMMKPFLGLIKRRMLTPAQGAAAVLRAATAPELAGVTGRYFVRDVEARSPEVSYDRDLQRRVRDASTSASPVAV